MNQLPVKNLRTITLVSAIVLLPVTGFMWSLPISVPMLIISGALVIASVVAVFLINAFFAASDKEVSRLAGELQEKSAEVIALVEAEREDDRIVDSLTSRINQLKSTLILVQSEHMAGQDRGAVTRALARPSSVPSNSILAKHQPRLYTPEEFQLLAGHFYRTASRYDRHFTLVRIVANLEERRETVGAEKADAEFAAAVDVIVRALRSSDFASMDGASALVIGYPETSATHVGAILSRLRAVLKASDARDLSIRIEQDGSGTGGPY